MTKITKHVGHQLAKDCITYRLSDDESVQYVRKYTGQEISLAWIAKAKAEVRKNRNINSWLADHARVGFAETHRQLMDEMALVQKRMLTEFLACTDEDRTIKLSSEIRENNKRISELNIGLPVIAQIKAKMELTPEKPQEKPIEAR